jgi:hypothetical protein
LLPTHLDLPEDFATESIKATFSLDFRPLCCYSAEDYPITYKGKHLLLLVVMSYQRSFTWHLFRIYEKQGQGCRPLIFGDTLLFQIEASLVKNVFSTNFMAGHYTQKRLCPLFSSKCGAALSLSTFHAG